MKFKLGISTAALLSMIFLAKESLAAPLLFEVLSSKNDNFRSLLINHIDARATQIGIDLFVENADGNGSLQFRQYDSALSAKVDAIIVNLVDDTLAKMMLEQAKSTKTPIVFYNYKPSISPLPDYAGYVGSDDVEAATLQMEELARKANYQGNVVILVGEPNHPAAKVRTETVEKIISKYPNMKIVGKTTAQWQRSEAANTVLDWIHKGINFSIIAANNDEMAIGAVRGLEKAEKKASNYIVGGIDGTADALQLVREGKISATVLQDAKGQGYAAVDMASRLVHQDMSKNVVWVPFKLITPESL